MRTTLTDSFLPGILVVTIGSFWGLYWAPLRRLEAVAALGPWATLAAVLTACLCLAPFAWAGRSRLRAANNRALASIALGGGSFVLYSNGLLYGQVAVVILFFYLTPVWSTLILRLRLGWAISGWRYLSIVSGLMGIVLVLQASHQGLPLPKTAGDLLGLASGILWSVASTGMYVHSRTGPAETCFVFCAGGTVMAVLLALGSGSPLPRIPAENYGVALGWTLLTGGIWWALSLSGFMWATRLLEPARVGILLMSEVVVGTVSAALYTDEPFALLMIAGAMLVVFAGSLEFVASSVRVAGRSVQAKRYY